MYSLTKWLKMMRKPGLLAIVMASTVVTKAQLLTLQDAWEQSIRHYPLSRQQDLLKQTRDISIHNLGKGFLPQLSLSGQASYQSEVTSLLIPLPGIKMDPLRKDQYRLTADVSQLLYDGGITRQQQAIAHFNTVTEEQKVAVELFQLKERITQLFLAVLLLDRQLQQVQLIQQDLQNGIQTVEAQFQNGLVLRSQVNTMKAEALKTDQRAIEIKSARKALLDVLGVYLGQSFPDGTRLMTPAAPAGQGALINRPELKLFESQQNLLRAQQELIQVRNRPRASAFVQGGYGRPGLNMLKNEFDPFYVAGIRFTWAFGGLYTARSEKKLLEINRQSVDVQKDVFLLQLAAQQQQQLTDIGKWTEMMVSDKEIIELRTSTKASARVQLENQVITASDYLREVNAEDAARQNLLLHELQLLQSQINFANSTGTYTTNGNK